MGLGSVIEVEEGVGELVLSKLEGVVEALSEALVLVGDHSVAQAASVLVGGILACGVS